MQFLDELNNDFEQTFKTMFDLSPDGFLIADIKGKVLYLSNSGKQMFGFDDSDIEKGLNLFDYVYPDDKVIALKNNADRVKGTYKGFSEYRVFHKDGTIFWNETNATFIKDKNGNLESLFVVFRDVTERKKQEAELIEAKKQAELANLVKTNFISNISHEIRTPLNSILGYSELLKEKITNEEHKQYISGIISGGKSLSFYLYRTL